MWRKNGVFLEQPFIATWNVSDLIFDYIRNKILHFVEGYYYQERIGNHQLESFDLLNGTESILFELL